MEIPAIAVSRCTKAPKSARFHDSIGPTAMATTMGVISGKNTELKKGGPTDTLPISSASAISGYSVPSSTVAAPVAIITLLNSRLPSRDSGANSPPDCMAGARTAYSTKDPPTITSSSSKMNAPRAGSLAKEWTEVSTPERTRKVPSSEKPKVTMASRMVQLFKAARFSTTVAECSKAVPASHGMNEAFSVGSQYHQPPQPSV